MKRLFFLLPLLALFTPAFALAQDQLPANDRLKALYAKSPEADTNGDGVLTMQEARDFLKMKRGAKTDGESTDFRTMTQKELLEIYEAHEFQGMPYRLLRPLEVAEGKRYPLILSLHGAGGKGDDNIKNLVSWNQILADQEHRQKYPAFVIVPQASKGGLWGPMPEIKLIKEGNPKNFLPTTFELVNSLKEELPIDPDRIYVLGASMGGYGSWSAIYAQPELFAAAIPVCGGLSTEKAATFKDVPIWCFHGADDGRVPVKYSRDLFAELKSLGGNMKYTELTGVGHGAAAHAFIYEGDDPEQGWVTQTSSDRCDPTPNVWEWLFAQHR